MTDKIWIDIEPEAFATSRRHEFEFQIRDYTWTYHTRIDYCIKDLVGQLEQLQKHAPNHTQVLCMGHKNNFRYAIYPRYKSNRRGIRKAAGYGALREWLAENYESVILPNVEADDVLGLMAGPGDLIYSKDKDLRTIKGTHMAPNGELSEVTELEANRNFYKQVLTGDNTDGYPGCPNVGVSAKLFSSDDWLQCFNETDFWQLVQGQYLLATKKLFDRHQVTDPLKFAMQMARIARILRPGEYDHDREKPVLWEGPS